VQTGQIRDAQWFVRFQWHAIIPCRLMSNTRTGNDGKKLIGYPLHFLYENYAPMAESKAAFYGRVIPSNSTRASVNRSRPWQDKKRARFKAIWWSPLINWQYIFTERVPTKETMTNHARIRRKTTKTGPVEVYWSGKNSLLGLDRKTGSWRGVTE